MSEFKKTTKKALLPTSKKSSAVQKKKTSFSTKSNNILMLQKRVGNQAMQQLFKTEVIQKQENKTGLPENLKDGIESLSGYNMDDVKVHYNSPKPAQLNAYAFAQGSDIHLASGAEKYLPHEAWHVVQQKQGRVQPTKQLKGKVNINDNVGLEKEADVMGVRALQIKEVETNKLKNLFIKKHNYIQLSEEKDWKRPSDGVIQAWMYMQIDHWHTGAIQALKFFKNTISEKSTVGFWLGLAGNVTWALGSLISQNVVTTTVGLIGIMISTIGSQVQDHKNKKDSERITLIYEELLKGFNSAREKMDMAVISKSNQVVKLSSFKDAILKKSTDAWQQVVRVQAGIIKADSINIISNSIERNLYNKYLKTRGAWLYHDIFNIPSRHHPGLNSKYKNFYPQRIPKKVINRLKRIGVDWHHIWELPIPHRHRDLYRLKGTIGAIKYWNYNEQTVYPSSWTSKDIKEFHQKAPSYMSKIRKGITY